MMEIWKPIPDYDGYYEASNLGNIRSVARTIPHMARGRVTKRMYPGKRLAQSLLGNGYLVVSLAKLGIIKTKLVHRLVLAAFVEDDANKGSVNHRDGNKTDNSIENLEWATSAENITHSYRELNRKPPCLNKFGGDHNASKAVAQKTMDGEVIRIWDAAMDAVRSGFDGGCISRCCNGISKSHKGYVWEYALNRHTAEKLGISVEWPSDEPPMIGE